MANYSELLNDINAAIYENNDQEIDALEVRAILREMVTSLGSGFLFKGIATPSSPSGTGTYEPDQNVFYLATTAGTYTYLGGLVVAAGEVAFLCFDGTWTKKSSALLSAGAIVDNLTTNDATKVLSAKQGKVLKDGLDATNTEVSALGHEVVGEHITFDTTNWEHKNIQELFSLPTNDNYRLSSAIHLEEGSVIETYTSGASPLWTIVLCDSSGNISSGLVQLSGNLDENKLYSYTAAADCYVRVSVRVVVPGYYVKREKNGRLDLLESSVATINGEISRIDGEISGIKDDISEFVGLEGADVPLPNFTSGYLINLEQNALQASAAWSYSDPVELKAGTFVDIYTRGSGVGLLLEKRSAGNYRWCILAGDDSSNNKHYTYIIQRDGFYILSYRSGSPEAYVKLTFNEVLRRTIESNASINDLIQSNVFHGKIISSGQPSANANYSIYSSFNVRKDDVIELFTDASSGVSLINETNSSGEIGSSILVSNGSVGTLKKYTYIAPEDKDIFVCLRDATPGSYVRHYRVGYFDKTAAGDSRHLRLLLLGNSYTSDAWGYVPFILKQYGITCEIYMYWRGALSLDDLVTFWESDDAYDATSPQAAEGAYRFLYHIDTRTQDAWESLTRQSAKTLVGYGDWDIIMLQQWGRYSIDNSHTNPYFEQVMSLIRASCAEPFTLGWQMAWLRAVDLNATNKAANLQVAETINKEHCADIVFPCATAIFNCLENPSLASIGDSTYHNFFASDDVHLEEGLPCYAAGVAVAQTILRRFFPVISILGNTLRPDETDVVDWNVPQRQMPTGGVITSITDDNCYLVQKAAIIANKYPYEINGV